MERTVCKDSRRDGDRQSGGGALGKREPEERHGKRRQTKSAHKNDSLWNFMS